MALRNVVSIQGRQDHRRSVARHDSRARMVAVLSALVLGCMGTASSGIDSGVEPTLDAGGADGGLELDAGPALDAGLGADAGATRDAGPPFRPDLAPNTWVRVRDDLPSPHWETSVSYDARTASLVQHGGHLVRDYVQTPYTWRYDLRADAYVESRSSVRPPRRCIVESAYLEGPEKLVTVQGSVSHGSLPPGILSGWRVVRRESQNPWTYDAVADEWTEARPGGVGWPSRTHAGSAYDSTSGALYVVGSDALYGWSPLSNQVFTRPMPAALNGRRGYGITFDPDTRKLIIFGGSSRHWTYGPLDGDETDNCDVVPVETCASYYRSWVKADTWVLNIDEAAALGWPTAVDGGVPGGWHEVQGAAPPQGMPMWSHLRLSLARQPSTGRVLLVQNPISGTPNLAPATWPAVELWAFDPRAEAWTKVNTHEPPHFPGLVAYSPELEVLTAWGAGERGDAGVMDTNPTASRTLYLVRPEVPGATRLEAPSVERVLAEGSRAGVTTLRFAGVAGRRYEVARAPAAPLAGVYQQLTTIEATSAAVSFEDTTAGAETHAYRVREEGTQRWSLPGFDSPEAPTAVRALARSNSDVELSWTAAPHAVGYRVYRSGPSESYVKLTETAATTFHDTTVSLADGNARRYVVRALDAAGREGGQSGWAATVPDAPRQLDVRTRADGRFDVTWKPRDPQERLQLYYLDFHCNARASIEAYLNAFQPVVGGPLAGGSAVVDAPPVDPATRNQAPMSEPGECGRTVHPGHYFFGRIVGPLNQPGFWSDLVSPTDSRFRPAFRP